MNEEFAFDVRFFRLSPELAPYFTALYSFEFSCGVDAAVQDYLHPEWSAMRFCVNGTPPMASIIPEPKKTRWPFVVSGPTSRAIDFSVTTSRIFGLGLLPLGWARFGNGAACDIADTIVNASHHDAYAKFRPLLELAQNPSDCAETVAERFNTFLMEQDLSPVRSQTQIIACQDALRDPDLADVDQLASRVGVSRRTLERLTSRYFGFAPKLLLRRQRFLRSLGAFMTMDRRNWSAAIDGQYYDQAHFVRDFRSFMGVSPTEYAEMPHPIIDRIIAQRMADQGAAPQTDLPTVLRYTESAKSG